MRDLSEGIPMRDLGESTMKDLGEGIQGEIPGAVIPLEELQVAITGTLGE